VEVSVDGNLREHHFDEMISMFAQAPIGLCCFDKTLRFVFINDYLAAINGMSVEEHLGRSIREVIPDVAAGVEDQLREVIDTGEPIIGGIIHAETPAQPGRIRCFQHHYYAIKSEAGKVLRVACVVKDDTARMEVEGALDRARGELERRVEERTAEWRDANTALKREIAEREKIELALANNKERLRLLLETTNAIPWETDAKTWIFTYVGPQAVDLLGYPRERWLETNFWVDHMHPEDRAWAVDYCLSASHQNDNYEFDYRMIAADGRSVWLHDIVNVVRHNGAPVKLRGFMIDVTERKQTEESLHGLSARLITAQEEERSRIARELHDDFNQRLSILAMDLEQLAGRQLASRENLSDCLEPLIRSTKQLSSDIHRLSHQLHPTVLQHLGLVSATRSLCKGISNQHAIHIELVHHGVPRSLPGDVALCLYRIVQEALRNTIKHSGAKSARVEISGTTTELTLQITDDGTGFDPESAQTRQGLGLLSMRERLRLVNGTISFERVEPSGTRIDVRVSIPASDR